MNADQPKTKKENKKRNLKIHQALSKKNSNTIVPKDLGSPPKKKCKKSDELLLNTENTMNTITDQEQNIEDEESNTSDNDMNQNDTETNKIGKS